MTTDPNVTLRCAYCGGELREAWGRYYDTEGRDACPVITGTVGFMGSPHLPRLIAGQGDDGAD